MNYIDSMFDFKGRWDAPSRCGLKVVKKQDRNIMIITELFEDNPGTSVTEYSAELAGIIIREFCIYPDKLVFTEHCPDRGSNFKKVLLPDNSSQYKINRGCLKLVRKNVFLSHETGFGEGVCDSP